MKKRKPVKVLSRVSPSTLTQSVVTEKPVTDNPIGFRKGVKMSQGRTNPGGSGRHGPTWLQAHVRKLIAENDIIGKLIRIAAGEPEDHAVTMAGKVIAVPAPMTARVKASEILLDRGYGKPAQSLEVQAKTAPKYVALLPAQTEGESGGIIPALQADLPASSSPGRQPGSRRSIRGKRIKC